MDNKREDDYDYVISSRYNNIIGKDYIIRLKYKNMEIKSELMSHLEKLDLYQTIIEGIGIAKGFYTTFANTITKVRTR